jgi:hypothetical protein
MLQLPARDIGPSRRQLQPGRGAVAPASAVLTRTVKGRERAGAADAEADHDERLLVRRDRHQPHRRSVEDLM